jgi:two-component system nitrogen regulation response regulator GlnG
MPVLIRGETGTGKELAARAIHQASRRRGALCLCVNMGAIPATLATSELFGSVKGSFTGAVRDQAGYFQRAHGGTLFLDEIGEAPAEAQVLLLRVLETGEVQRIGSQDVQKVDVRLIAATDSDLEKAIEEGRFRAPLFHRLSGYEMSLPPLRERREDFGRLFFHFLREELRALGEERRLDPPEGTDSSWLPASIVARLVRHPWPGNVRQLRNAVRQIVVDSRTADTMQVGPLLERLLREAAPQDAAEAVAGSAAAVTPFPMSAPAPRRRAQATAYRSPSEVVESDLLEALRANRWEVKAAAAQLGISRPALYLLLDKFPGIRKAADLSRDEILEVRELCGGDLNAMVNRLEVSKKGLLQRMNQLGIV